MIRSSLFAMLLPLLSAAPALAATPPAADARAEAPAYSKDRHRGRDRHRDRDRDRDRDRGGHRAGWDKLGEQWVEGRFDADSIRVGARDGRFESIRLVAENSDLELYDVVIYFGDGTWYSPETRLYFSEGSASREIDLPGGRRVIREVQFRYGNRPGGGRAKLELWGR